MATAKAKSNAPQPPVPPGDNFTPQISVRMMKALSVQSSREGFRRAGRAWSKEAVVVPLSELSEGQIEQLRNEAMLTVTETDIPAPEAGE